MKALKSRKLPLLWHQKRLAVIALTLFYLAFITCFNWAGWHAINIAKAETIESINQYIQQEEHPKVSSPNGVHVLDENGQLVQSQAVQAEEPLDIARTWLEIMGNFGQLITVVVLATVGFVCGTIAEKKHYASIKRREFTFRYLPAVPIALHHFLSEKQQALVTETQLVTGCVVVSQDYFKMILAGLKNILGGRVSSYESLMDRARREAILRMKEQAPDADAIVNVRLESLTMGKEEGDKKPICSIQVLAYGTAVTLHQPDVATA
jgi:uncharacterized protein YbjQ (UPF0145 family)